MLHSRPHDTPSEDYAVHAGGERVVLDNRGNRRMPSQQALEKGSTNLTLHSATLLPKLSTSIGMTPTNESPPRPCARMTHHGSPLATNDPASGLLRRRSGTMRKRVVSDGVERKQCHSL